MSEQVAYPRPLAAGVWGVVATPFTGDDLGVDTTSLTTLVQHYATIGAVGLTVLGVFGEAAQLDSAERRTVLETVRDSVDLPLVVGITALRTAPAIEEVRAVRSVLAGRLAGAMVQVNSADPDTLAQHLQAIHAATGAGLVVQDYPLVSGVAVRPAELVTALRTLPSVVAVKAEAPPTPASVATLADGLTVPVFGGLGGLGLLDELASGAAGAMTGFSVPEGLLACVAAWRRGGYPDAREAYLPYLPLVNFEQQPTIGLAIRKESLRERDLIASSAVRPPAAAMPEALRSQLRRHLQALRLAPSNARARAR
jgi:4-hydroxy-tetrahydrodipicolinate synthase